MRTDPGDGLVRGECAKCEVVVYEREFILDDCFNVYVGACPNCGARNLLQSTSLSRGYDSKRMSLVLPYKVEIEKNGWPTEWPTQD
jgi:hypothetical protein